MRVFVAGATGFIGGHLVDALLARGDDVVALSRSKARAEKRLPEGVEIVEGDPGYEGDWQAAISGCQAVVNLAGESVDAKRWNAQFRQKLRDSRIDSTRHIGEAIVACEGSSRPYAWANASGIDFYAAADPEFLDDDEIDESAPRGESFLSILCEDWEAETRAAAKAGVHVACMRTGFVCANGGALSKLALSMKGGVGSRHGSGKQWMSWIHIEDAIRSYLWAIDGKVEGPVNMVAPGNVRNAEFCRVLGKTKLLPVAVPVPAFALRAAVGEFSQYVLQGRNAVPKSLAESGFTFEYPEWEPETVKSLNL